MVPTSKRSENSRSATALMWDQVLYARLQGILWYIGLVVALSAGCSDRRTNNNPTGTKSTGSIASDSFRIASSSMLPALKGPMLGVDCSNCAAQSWIASDSYHPELPTRCYLCGGLCSLSDRSREGDVVEVHALDDRELAERFDLVAFVEHAAVGKKSSLSGEAIPLVKRVWGLPGEQIRIEDGELWIDGELFRKSLGQLKQVAVPIWILAEAKTLSPFWRVVPDSRAGEPTSTDDRQSSEQVLPSFSAGNISLPAASSWLEFVYHQPARVRPAETPSGQWLAASPLNDDYVANQGASYPLLGCADYLVSLKLAAPLEQQLEIRLQHSDQQVTFVSEMATASSLTGSLRVPLRRSLTLAVCDGRLLVETDLARPLAVRLENPSQANDIMLADSLAPAAGQALLAIKSQTATEVCELTIHRDIVLRTIGRNPGKGVDFGGLSEDGYFLLGDNQPVSTDSRGDLGPVYRQQIIGTVVQAE